MAGTTPLGPRSEPKSAGFPAMPAPSGRTMPRTPSSAHPPTQPPTQPPAPAPAGRGSWAERPAPPPAGGKGPRVSLTWKVFLGAAAVVTVVLGLTLALTNISAKRAADQAIDRGLAGTADRVQS